MNYLLLATLYFQTTEPVGVPGWVPIVIAVILLLLFWWGLSRNSIPQGVAEQAAEHNEHPEATVAMAAPEEADAAATTAVTPDDLKIVEGIGPKIEGVLHNAGINTFAKLAEASISELEKIVREDAGIRIAFPDTWPEQAQLAANGKWAELEQLQEDLKGGRRA